MAGVLEGLISSRRRPSRSRSESAKQMHARWGDVSITAPTGGWTQHYLEDDLNNVTYQAHGSPDSQKTLVSNSPDLTFKDEIEKIGVEAIITQSPPLIQKERAAITITIPLPWSRKSHRRSSSASSHPQPQAQPVPVLEKLITVESRPAHANITSTIDEVIVAESRPATESLRADSPIVHTQSPVYDDVSTFFTRAVFPEKHPGHRLPQIQTAVPPNKSQPASAVSLLSPVAEKYNGLSESNNGTPMDNTPIAERIESAIHNSHGEQVDVAGLVGRLESHVSTTPPTQPFPPIPSSDEAPDSAVERPDSRRTPKPSSRPSSRGPGIGEVAYMRASSRGASEQSSGQRSASRENAGRRAASVERARRRTLSREPIGRRADSPPFQSRRALSRDPALRRADSAEPKTRRAVSREQAVLGSVSPEANTPHFVTDDVPLRPRAESPGPWNRRAHSREPAVRREASPLVFSRRAISREPYSRRRISGDYSQRAVSVDPIMRRTSPRTDGVSRHASPLDDIFALRQAIPREDFVPRRGTPIVGTLAERDSPGVGSTPPAEPEPAPDEATDIETETDEMYFESRKGWNGPAVAGTSSRGFYGDVVQDYKLIARDVEAELAASEAQASAMNIVALIKKEKEREAHKPKVEATKEERVYEGPDLVPPQEELWG
ncbi:uncharacterized protein PV07_09505 [Cladophialophora immunda]|uniref:Uncharacterized protein n=1 Tax=Cladophialophora immunda TaxID=569365 RepID=A0A0D2C5H2_9EURO|nr:uncharacterized protein PV07_09505 [Cladophialophora immunda]KIW26408.1 hypothetical protein PV07_09505 [Cladophialophora immunda]OQV05443.1 hypothetical protein CLAIMM_10184 [Cladophialophora immunda]